MEEYMGAYDRTEGIRGAAIILLALLAFLLAGTMDLEDRTQGLGASMVPDPEWQQAAG